MALFDSSSPGHILSLLRVGFAARLRSEVADIFLAADADDSLCRVDSREHATVFFFLSGDAAATARTPSLPHAALTAVLARRRHDADDTEAAAGAAAFVSISPSQSGLPSLSTASLTDTPCLLRLSLEQAPNPRRTLFALATPGPHPHYLTFAGVRSSQPASTSPTFSKHALFHFEIVPRSLGKSFIPGPFPHMLPYLLPAQALTHALLQLGVTFRITSAHATRLSPDPDGKNVTLVPVRGTRDSTAPLMLAAFMRTHPVPEGDAASFFYTVVDANDKESAVVLKSSKSSSTLQFQSQGDSQTQQLPVLRLHTHDHAWGAISLGLPHPQNQSSSSDVSPTSHKPPTQSSVNWLMATPDAKFGMRPHRRKWETFTVEFVTQAMTAALSEITVPSVYDIAEHETRSGVRADIARRVAESSGSRPATEGIARDATKKNHGKGAFNHAAALGALSEESKAPALMGLSPAAEASAVAGITPGKRGKKNKKKNSAGLNNPAAAARNLNGAAVAASGLPRNVANRKASKKSRKKKRAAAAAAASAAASANMAASAAPIPKKKDSTTQQDLEKGSFGDNADSSSSASSSSSDGSKETEKSKDAGAASGPPCAACGRPLSGSYTTAMGKSFHAHCFCCGHCRRPMGAGKGQFRERGGTPYCDNCYAMHIASRCARCSQPIMETVTTAMDKTWHKSCLTCTICRLPLTETFWLYADRPNEPRCSRCVTGDEHARVRRSGGRMVNLPGFGPSSNRPAIPPGGSHGTGPTLGGSSSSGGRVRLQAPVLPIPPRR